MRVHIEWARLRAALWVAALPGGLLFAAMQTYGYWKSATLGLDSHAYWVAARDPASWYTLPPLYTDAYLYSPAFAQLLAPLGLLPWHGFQLVWFAAGAGTMWWLLHPLGALRGVVAALFLAPDLLIGNVYTFYAAVLVLAVRGMAAGWALPLLTKVTPGVCGLWHVVRGEWRAASLAAGSTVVLVAASVAIDPDAWQRWISFLTTSSGSGGGTVALRVALAAAITAYAARKSLPWLLAPAMIIACPVLEGYAIFGILAALPRLCRATGPGETQAASSSWWRHGAVRSSARV